MTRRLRRDGHVRRRGNSKITRRDERHTDTRHDSDTLPSLCNLNNHVTHCFGNLVGYCQGAFGLTPGHRFCNLGASAFGIGRHKPNVQQLGEIGEKPVLTGKPRGRCIGEIVGHALIDLRWR